MSECKPEQSMASYHAIEVINERLNSERQLREALVKLLDERDRAHKEAVANAFASADKAMLKTEQALSEYKSSANEWRATLSDVVSRTVTRAEHAVQNKALEDKINELREFRSGYVGRSVAEEAGSSHLFWLRGAVLTSLLGSAAIIVTLILFIMGRK